ncbi:molybdopterin-synthase adenylyltransferase MoeB [Photobacterium phosphoreum]|jgi:adenylyltransferase/sulfurtransferase|uniref:Molybdopterin-synthase adenylyltransferase n=1 Tax=Photobacterium phosphoreum TaxID=659 RepID=A0AAW4ZZ56_PHOPO|nr:molybdopterin-synthase adenylyltransferase MoeB [Photobacterium phosphoreum]MCD9464224.1 molybdopterin-synthase adenylyltransferase MoeB [Photobacterium phosphoreum]MCD9471739.1 molybdopterin-synthase adenylyltransferase MoeB [Photobacterium phosphoreum]MCD9475078.1 molybdopterin-synthase adenylyltransferase MoeB [Photobacterium phosphoreum]MCD9479135.1 molybdopterin-synthase adenylyltransferase MoeB [Photobacterium phosphoreum]MCD9483283.1 molybdopterin-synthase adenylyltransferase MoeB [P
MTIQQPTNAELSDQEMLRYNRQIILRQFDFEGQEALKASSMLILGAGGLGCASSQYLAAAGVGKITLIDDDKVEVSNLQRQVLHTDATVGMLKVNSAKQALTAINPYLTVDTIAKRLTDEELLPLIKQHSLVLDCCDNVDTRNQLNRLCFETKTPLVSGAAIRMEGQISVYSYRDGEPCYQCLSALFGQQTLTCVEAGIMSPVVGIVGAVQAMEAIKVAANIGTPLTGKILMLDAMSMSWREMKLMKQPSCSVCG